MWYHLEIGTLEGNHVKGRGPGLPGLVLLVEETPKSLFSPPLPCEDAARWFSASQEDSAQQNLTMQACWSDFQPPEQWENEFLLFKSSAYSILLRQPKQTQAVGEGRGGKGGKGEGRAPHLTPYQPSVLNGEQTFPGLVMTCPHWHVCAVTSPEPNLRYEKSPNENPGTHHFVILWVPSSLVSLLSSTFQSFYVSCICNDQDF